MTPLAQEAARLLGATPIRATPLAGGDLSAVLRLDLTRPVGLRTVIVKSGPAPQTEAAMLRAIRAAGAPCPEVIAASDRALVLECLPERGRLNTQGWAELGRALARLHASEGPQFGWPEDYAFGSVPIRNQPSADWPAFWAENRLLSEARHLPSGLRRRLDALARSLPDLIPAPPRPSLLHGDLWAGNVIACDGRFVGVIDPACYWGDAEVDLAMLHLFGAPPPVFHAAYGPLPPGWETRRALYQLWPAIVHLRLFGAGYRGMVEGLLGRLGH